MIVFLQKLILEPNSSKWKPEDDPEAPPETPPNREKNLPNISFKTPYLNIIILLQKSFLQADESEANPK